MKTYIEFITEKALSYSEVLKNQKIDNPSATCLFSNEDSNFTEEIIHINKLREYNELNNLDDLNEEEYDQTISYFNEMGMMRIMKFLKDYLKR